MTDRELLEFAAKAAGYAVVGPAPKYIAQGCNEWALIVRNSKGGDSVFDPLTYNGDALRLAVKLGIEIHPDTEVMETITAFMVGNCGFNTREEWGTLRDGSDNDTYAATRRAITRAAAEIGRAMP